MTDHGSFTGESSMKRQKIESISFQKKDNFYHLFVVLLCFVLFNMCYIIYSESFSSWHTVEFDMQNGSYFINNETSHPSIYGVDPKLKALINEISSALKPPPTGPQYHVAFPQNYHFILDQENVCKLRPPFLVLMVPVASHNVEARNAIRQTWGKPEVVQGELVLTLFMLGLSGQADVEEQWAKIQHENLQHQDLILSNFIDSYVNLTIKTMVIMDWLATHCSNAAYAMKIDSDTFLNIDNLVIMLKKPNTPKTNYLTGIVVIGGVVIRNVASKWYIPKEVYPHPKYPLYTMGQGYIFSNDLAEKFVEISKTVKLINLEDVYIGMCMQKLGLRPSFPPISNLFTWTSIPYNPCTYSKIIMCSLKSTEDLVKFWTDLKKPGPPCKKGSKP